MQLILPKGRLGWREVCAFYTNRALRIYPLYFAVLLISAPFVLYFLPWRQPYINLQNAENVFATGTLGAMISIIVTNATMVGQDAMRFLVYIPADGAFIYRDGSLGEPSALGSSMQILPQSWSIALELYFYLLVPFLLPRSTRFIVGISVLSIIARIAGYMSGLDGVNFAYAAFPFELATFLSGALACRVYLAYRPSLEGPYGAAIAVIGGGVLFLYGFWYGEIPGSDYNSLKHWGAVVCAIALLPFLFAHTRASAVDRFAGELSYPIYIVHITVIVFVIALGAPSNWRGWVVIAVTMAASVIALKLIQGPLDRIRHQHFGTTVKP